MAKYKRKEGNIESKIHDEIVMVNVKQGNYFGLNSVGSDVWEFLSESRTIDEIVKELMNSYDIDQETCASEVNSYIQKLIEMDLIESD